MYEIEEWNTLKTVNEKKKGKREVILEGGISRPGQVQ
jgi:hypothetical protein